MVFWFLVAAVALTMIVGFTWGGWVTAGTARATATTLADGAVVKRLAPICVVQSADDPQRARKLTELKAESAWKRGEYIEKQGWATMPGEDKPDSRVAEECATLLTTDR
jgi:hypothetical protein